MEEIERNDEFYEQYFGGRLKAIENYFSSPEIESKLDELIKSEFNQYFYDSIDRMKRNYKNLSHYNKRSFFAKLRETLVLHRLSKPLNKKIDPMTTQNHFKPLLFDEDNSLTRDQVIQKKIGHLQNNTQTSIKIPRKYIDSVTRGEIPLGEFMTVTPIEQEGKISKVEIDLERLYGPNQEPEINRGHMIRSQMLATLGGNEHDQKVQKELVDMVNYGLKRFQDISGNRQKKIVSQMEEDLFSFVKETKFIDAQPYVTSLQIALKAQVDPALVAEEVEKEKELILAGREKFMSTEINYEDFTLFDDSKSQKRIESYEDMLMDYVINAKMLNGSTNHLRASQIEGKRNPLAVRELQKELKELLVSTYCGKLATLCREAGGIDLSELGNILFSKKKMEGSQTESYLEKLDTLIQTSLREELNTYVKAHTFFLYSMLSIEKLDGIFGKLAKMKEAINEPLKLSEDLAETFSEKNKKIVKEHFPSIRSPSDLYYFLKYLDTVAEQVADIRAETEGLLHSNENLTVKVFDEMSKMEWDRDGDLMNKNDLVYFLKSFGEAKKLYNDFTFAKKYEAKTGEVLPDPENNKLFVPPVFTTQEINESERTYSWEEEPVLRTDLIKGAMASAGMIQNRKSGLYTLVPAYETYVFELDAVYTKATKGELSVSLFKSFVSTDIGFF